MTIKLPVGTIEIKNLIHSDKTGNWCKLPYPNHPRGCPNYGRIGCHPSTTKIIDIVDLRRIIYFVHSEFNLTNHVKKMKRLHPQWTDRQLKNVLYWQGSSRKRLRSRVKTAMYLTGCNFVSYCPEGQGINVYASAIKSGFVLEKIRRLRICRHIALLGFLKR